MTWEEWVSLAALLLATAAVVVGLVLLRRLSQTRRGAKPLARRVGRQETPSGPPAFVVNPIKVPDPAALRRLANQVAAANGLGEPLWYETVPEDSGGGQARQAVADGASVVVAAGGDGTVRAVAGALSGSPVPMGLIPMGTGNLLARNLDLPLGDVRGLVDVALTGPDHEIDVGYLRAVGADDSGGSAGEEHCFLVMAGLGFDAAMVAGADDALKKRVGWLAYFLAGVRHLHSRRLRITMTLDGHEAHLRLRSLLFANCGRLPGGIVLLPQAEVDDGFLDIAGIDTKGGVIGWASLFGKVLIQGVGFRRNLQVSGGTIEFWRGHELTVTCEAPEPVQVDGDLVAKTDRLSVTVRPGALTVRSR